MILWVGRRRVAVPAVAPGLAVVAALAVQVCRPGGADLMVGVVAPLIVLAVGASGPGGTSRGLVSAVLAVQAALHVGCAVGLAPVPVHVAAGGWHLLLAALSVLLVRVGEQSLAAVLVETLTRWTGAAADVALHTARVKVPACRRRPRGRVHSSRASGRAPPLGHATASA